MRGASASRCMGTICALAALAVLASPAAAIEFFDERLSIHGFYGMQVRSIMEDFNTRNRWDLTQWYHILNLEIEAEIAPDGVGPFDLISAFGRIEVRYDCVWTRGCAVFHSADAYGDRANRLPERLHAGRRNGYTMQGYTGDQRPYRRIPFDQQDVDNWDLPVPTTYPSYFGNIPGLAVLSASKGPDQEFGTEDDPWPYYTFGLFPHDECGWGVQSTKGNVENSGTRNLPVTPACTVSPIAGIANRANPLREGDYQVVHRYGGQRRAPAPARAGPALHGDLGRRLGGPGPVAPQP